MTITKGNASSDDAKNKLEFQAATADGYIPFKITGADAYRGNPDANADPLVEGGWVDIEVKVKGKTVGAARVVIAPQLWVRMEYGEFGSGRGSPETRYEELSARCGVLRNRIKSTAFFPNKTMAALITKKEFEGAFSQKGLIARTRAGVVASAVGRIAYVGGNYENKVRLPELYDTAVFLAGMYFTDVMKEEYEGSLGFISPRGQNLKYPNDQVSVLIRATQNAQKSTNQTFDALNAITQPPTPGGVKWYTIENFSFTEQVVFFPNVVVERLVLIRPRVAGDDKTIVDKWTQIFEDNEANFAADEIKKYEFAPK